MTVLHSDPLVLIGLVVAGALWLVSQLALSLRVLRAAHLPRLVRVLGALPPFSPVVGFFGGARGLAILWCVLSALYVVLRMQA